MKTLYFCILILSLTSTTVTARDSIHYFDLKNRTANEVIPILQPLLQQNESISGDGYQLFIRTSNLRAQELETLLQSIDRAAKMFRISVTNDAHTVQRQNSIEGSVRVKTGDADIRIGNTRYIDEGLSVDAVARTTESRENKIQFINVQEGKVAFVSREKNTLIPVYSYVERVYGVAEIDHGYSPLATEDGFYVEARAADTQHAKITSQTASGNNRDNQHYNHEQQYTETELRVPFGKWFEIGGTTDSYYQSSKGILYRTKEEEERYNKIFLKVELLN